MTHTYASLTNSHARLALGALTGLVSLIAMIRLVSGAFSGALSVFAWVFVLMAMIPWIGYASWRARHGRISARGALAVLVLCVAGLLCVWLFVLGPVVALACSLAAFTVIWVSDWPLSRPPADDEFVRVEDLATEDSGSGE